MDSLYKIRSLPRIMNTFEFISSALELSRDAISYTVSLRLAELYPDSAVLEGPIGYFNLEEYAKAGLCELSNKEGVHNQIQSGWDLHAGVGKKGRNAWYSISWNGASLQAVLLSWNTGFHEEQNYWLVADDLQTAESFFSEVSSWNAEVRDEVLVFDGGCWSKSDSLFKAIQTATFENLILAGSLKEEIRDDLARFFHTRETYEAHGVPWKRGILFVGPPGNGKTHAVKALINFIKKPCLYVKSFQSEHGTEHQCIRDVFSRARKSAPCILVLEDLDSLINEGNRSFFLNELDGFAANSGVVALATTNHPERLDVSILDRPSRFDRKYHFDLPAAEERLSYVRLWSKSLGDALRPTEAGLALVVASSDGFSFAYLKELFLSSMMRWISNPAETSMDAILAEQVDSLRVQMASAPPDSTDVGDPSPSALHPWMRQMFSRGMPGRR